MRHVYGAANEFLARYGQAFSAAWKVRSQLDPPKRSEDELAFLPAQLELVESPASPAARWTMRIIMALFCVALLWSIFGKLDIVAVASGKTVVNSRTKVIQTAETAVIRRILVRDGQAVRKGDVLVELDATATGADFEQAGDALLSARLAALRYEAMAKALDDGHLAVAPEELDIPKDRVRAEWLLAASELAEYQVRRQSLLASITQRQAQENTVRSQIAPMEQSLAISKERVEDLEKLLGSQYVSRHEFLARKQEMVEMERSLTAQRATLLETRSALTGAREELRVRRPPAFE